MHTAASVKYFHLLTLLAVAVSSSAVFYLFAAVDVLHCEGVSRLEPKRGVDIQIGNP